MCLIFSGSFHLATPLPGRTGRRYGGLLFKHASPEIPQEPQTERSEGRNEKQSHKERNMHSAGTNRAKVRMNIFDVGPRFGATKLAAGAPYTRACCECVGVRATRALTLAMLSALLFIAALPAHAQTETVLYNFTGGSDGGYPSSRLTPDGKGNFFGTTEGGSGDGTVFELSPNGSGGWNETTLYAFCSAPNCTDGASPTYSYILFDTVGNLYGTTCGGGADRGGVVWELSPAGASWTETVLYSFTNKYGCPIGGLITDSARNLYGTVYDANGPATVFELSPSGDSWTEQVIYSYSADGGEGYNGLTMDAAGNIFGSSVSTVFQLSPNGNGGWTPAVIFTFEEQSGPSGIPVLDQAGNLYGTTIGGGAKGYGTVYKLKRGKLGKWSKTILYAFKGSPTDGESPVGGVVLDAAGNIYGTTFYGGSTGSGKRRINGDGTVFELVPPVGTGSYQEKFLWSFTGADGENPYASVILDSGGNLYGTTSEGGSNGWGVVFEVTP